jgi:predicted HicB family RNase H-like nuclease
MARPRTYVEKRVPTAVRLPESVHRRLHQVAEERAVSANLLVTRAVEEYLDRLPTLDESLATTAPRAARP